MTQTHPCFRIDNSTADDLALFIEPHGLVYQLKPGLQVDVRVSNPETPPMVSVAIEEGRLVLSIWPGHGTVRVEHDGEEVTGYDL